MKSIEQTIWKKNPTSLMICGCMSVCGVGKLHFVESTVNAAEYINNLGGSSLSSINIRLKKTSIFFR